MSLNSRSSWFVASLVLTLVFSASARDYITPRDVVARYNTCVKFLKMTPKQQREVAARTTIGLEAGLRACRSVVHRGIAKSMKDAKEWNRWESGQSRHSSGGGSDTSNQPRVCWQSNECGALEHCYEDRCESTSNRCISDSQCTGGEACRDGICAP